MIGHGDAKPFQRWERGFDLVDSLVDRLAPEISKTHHEVDGPVAVTGSAFLEFVGRKVRLRIVD